MRFSIAHIKKNQNLFILDFSNLSKVMQVIIPNQSNKKMQVISFGRSTHLVSKIKKVRIWYKKFRHASNGKIIRVSKFLIGMGSFDNVYNLPKIYNNFE